MARVKIEIEVEVEVEGPDTEPDDLVFVCVTAPGGAPVWLPHGAPVPRRLAKDLARAAGKVLLAQASSATDLARVRVS